MTTPTTEQIDKARYYYKFKLAPGTSDRCSTCEHKTLSKQGSYRGPWCKLLEIGIANPQTSGCMLYKFDGIPF